MVALFWIGSLVSLLQVLVFFAHQTENCWSGRGWGHVDRVHPEGAVQSCRGFCSVPGAFRELRCGESFWLFSLLVLCILGLTIWVWFVMFGRLLDGHHGPIPFELVKDGDLLFLIEFV